MIHHPTRLSRPIPSEAQARIKINRLLEESGWRFFDDKTGSANIQLEHNVKLSQKTIDDLGDNFEKRTTGFVDFLLLDFRGIPHIMFKAKSNVAAGSAKGDCGGD